MLQLMSHCIGCITSSKKAKMNYFNYEFSIIQLHSVKIVGWPMDLKFANPSEIGTVVEIRKLRNALRSGTCHWVKMSKAQLNAHIEDLKNRSNEGEAIVKPRKKRSDAGTTGKRKRKTNSSKDQENERGPAQKVRKTTRARKEQRSVSIIESSEEEEED